MSDETSEPEAEPEPGSGFELLRDPELIALLATPLRSRIYREAVKEPVSPKELANRLEQPLPRVSYHVRTLADAGLLRIVRRTPRRGAVETHYRAIAVLDIDDEALRALPVDVRRTLFAVPVKSIAEDMLHSLGGEQADAPDLFITRAHFTTTSGGRDRLRREVIAMYERLGALARELRAEAEASADDAHELNVVLMNYAGSRDAGRNAPYMVAWDRPGTAPLPLIPD